MSKSNNQVIVNNGMTSLRAGNDVYRKDYIAGRMILPLKNLQRINADAACSTYEMSVGTLVDILTCHSHYTTKQIADLVEDTRKLENSNFKLCLSERGFVYVSRETYPVRTTTPMFVTEFIKCAKEVQELFEYFTNSDIDDSVRKPATDLEFAKLRDELFDEHNLFVALRGRKFVPIEAGTIFELSKNTDSQLLEIVNAYADGGDAEVFLEALNAHRNKSTFGMAFISSGVFKRIYYVSDYNATKAFPPKHNTINIKHYNDICKED